LCRSNIFWPANGIAPAALSGAHIPLDELLESEVADFELAETLSADQLYERHWALAVLEQVLGFSKDLTKVEAVFAARTCRAIRALTNCYEFRSPRFRSSRAGRGLP